MRRLLALALVASVGACASHPRIQSRRALAGPRPSSAATSARADAPPFAEVPYEPFSAAAVVAVARREWRLFGGGVDDDPPGTRPPPPPDEKPEREEGLWQRVGEYWWLGMDPGSPESGWTGKHDGDGNEFPADQDDSYAWSAAFVSYVMRIAGAGARFPYAAAHHTYIDAAREVALGQADWAISAEPVDGYAPLPGDLICFSRTPVPVRFEDLPAGDFAAHCAIVVGYDSDMLDVIGGNVDDAVTLTHVPVTADGKLAGASGAVLDTRYPWFVVVRVLYGR
jgi:hypothetical protein